MAKKRKLNSKNPKYWDQSLLNKDVVEQSISISNTNGVKISAVWYKTK